MTREGLSATTIGPFLADCVEKVRRTVDINSVLKWNSLFRETGRPRRDDYFQMAPFRGMIFYSDSARVHRGKLTTTFSTESAHLRHFDALRWTRNPDGSWGFSVVLPLYGAGF
jgi:hypothetical protein